MYEDDTNVTFSTPTIPDLESQVNNKVKDIDLWLKANKLSVDIPKTEFMIVTSRQKLQFLNDYTININVDGPKTTHSKSLGLNIDKNLSCKVFLSVGVLKRVGTFVAMHTGVEMYKGLIEPYCDYCSAVWAGLSQQLSDKLQKLQNCAARVITNSSYDADYSKRSFSYSGALLRNNLLEEVRRANSLNVFKRSVQSWFADQYSHTANM